MGAERRLIGKNVNKTSDNRLGVVRRGKGFYLNQKGQRVVNDLI
jgi:hypothetical protein